MLISNILIHTIMSYYDYDDYDDYGYNDSDDNESGCGEGWSCSNCPNFGCPANEYN